MAQSSSSIPKQDSANTINSIESTLYHGGNGSGNLLFSPYNIRELGELLKEGSGGDTKESLERLFGASSLSPVDSAYKSASGLFIQNGYKSLPEFKKILAEKYKTEILSVDFRDSPQKAAKSINGWIDAKTSGLIQKLVTPASLKPDTKLFLAATSFFDALWVYPFSPSLNYQAPFNDKAKITYMKRSAKLQYFESESLQIAALPYRGTDVQLMLFLPKNRYPLQVAEETLFGAPLPTLSDKIVEVHLPKIDVSFEYPLKSALQKANLEVLFGNSADFSPITGDKSLYVSDAAHKCRIVFDELSTKAAAASGVGFATKSIQKEPIPEAVMKLDRPFLFALIDTKSNTLLFIGKVTAL